MSYFSVKNFEKFQHYKDRKPPWIKLYHETFEDYEFGKLPDASKMHLIAIWSLASRYNNKIPADAEWISKRINATEKVDLKALAEAGFIELDQGCSKTLAKRKQSAMPETEAETDKKENIEKKSRPTRLPENFPGTDETAWALSRGLSEHQVEREVEKFTEHWGNKSGKGATKLDWSKTWKVWINNAIDRGWVVISGGGDGLSEMERSILEKKGKRQREGAADTAPTFLAAGGMR